jgi:hypothetical protein
MRIRLQLLAALVLLAIAHPARADFNIAIGLRYNPLNYTTPFSTTGAAGGGTAGTTPLSGFNTTNLNNYFGMFFLDGRVGFHVGLDLGYSSRHDETAGVKQDLSYTQFGFSLAGKFYILKPRGGHVSPYLYLDFYKYFASISTSETVPKGYEQFLAGLVSPLGIDLAVGAEYFFTPGFSIGAEVLGLKYAYTDASYTPGAGIAATTVSETNHYVTFYTGLSLNYRWDVTVKVSAREANEETEEPEARPRKKKKDESPPPPSEPPPASPESVD